MDVHLCTQCCYASSGKQVQLHQWQAHGIRQVEWSLAATNECPTCRQVYTTVREARRHCAATITHGYCKVDRYTYKGQRTRQPIERHACDVCGTEVQGDEAIREHMRSHMSAMLRTRREQLRSTMTRQCDQCEYQGGPTSISDTQMESPRNYAKTSGHRQHVPRL